MDTNNPTLILVHWEDSYGGGGWTDSDKFEPHVAKCMTAGFLIHEDEKSLTVTSSMNDPDDDNKQYMAPITIPKSCITGRCSLPWREPARKLEDLKPVDRCAVCRMERGNCACPKFIIPVPLADGGSMKCLECGTIPCTCDTTVHDAPR